jgi:tetratricopeptide (TPR) repeat protein
MTGADRKLSRCKATLAAGLCAALLCQGGPLGAQSDDENARRHFESGAAYLQQSDNENALREFQAAYALSKRPALLLNIANVYERMGKPREAVDTLTKYLDADPKAADRTTQETRIANLKKRIESEPAPPPAASAAPAPSAAPTTSTSSTTSSTSSAPPPPLDTAKPARAPNRTGAYVLLGVGGASAVGAVITGVIAKGKYDKADHGSSACKPSCPDDTVNPIKSMALVSTILTGVAVVSVGVGGVLFFTAKPPASDTASLSPSLQAGVAPGGGKVEATWRF